MTFSGFDNMTVTGKNPLSYKKINGICTLKTTSADNLKIEIPINNILTGATYNKDNKVNKLVTVFAFVPAIMTNYNCRYRDRSSASLKTLYTLTYYLLPTSIVPRNPYNYINFVPGRQKPRHASLLSASKTS